MSRVQPSSPEASRRMAKVRQTGAEAELALRRELFSRGLRYRVSFQVLKKPRRVADIAFPGLRVAVFVDGCFWHGCPKHATWPKQNPEFWRHKIETNRARDADTVAKLQAANWKVLRVWAHESPADAAAAISLLVVRIKEMQAKSRPDSARQR
ncbi:naeI very short patch repair endonuclease [Nitrospirota bacterium]|nr:naeI very short patch repair endonuclease [Nitrospirota bacterium]GDX89113.1 very short patch repair endonuclease [Nitrospirota bacterium]